MADEQTSDAEEERVLAEEAERLERLEKNPTFQSLSHESQKHLLDMLRPTPFNMMAELRDRIEAIQVCKTLIKYANDLARKDPESSELCAEVVEGNKWCITNYLDEIRRIKRGELKVC